MKPVTAYALVYEDNGMLHADLMGRPSIGHRDELNQDRWRMGAGLKVVKVLIVEAPKSRKR